MKNFLLTLFIGSFIGLILLGFFLGENGKEEKQCQEMLAKYNPDGLDPRFYCAQD